MHRLFVFVALTAFVLFLNWLVDWPPADPAVTPPLTAARQATLDLPVQLDPRAKRVGEALDRLAQDYQAPLVDLEYAKAKSWRDKRLIEAGVLDQKLRLEDALWLLQSLSEGAFAWEWRGRELAIRASRSQARIDADLRLPMARRNLPAFDQSWDGLMEYPSWSPFMGHPRAVADWLDTPHAADLLERLADRESARPGWGLSPSALAAHQAAEAALEREVQWQAGELRLDELLRRLQRQVGVNFVFAPRRTEGRQAFASHLVTSPGGRLSVLAGLRRALAPLGFKVQIQHGLVFVGGSPEWRLRHRFLRAYPLWPYRSLWTDPSRAPNDCENYIDWRYMGEAAPVRDHEDAVLLLAGRDIHREFEEFLDGLLERRLRGTEWVDPSGESQVHRILNSRQAISLEPAFLPEFIGQLSRQLGIAVVADEDALLASEQPLQGGGSGGTVAEQLDRVLLPQRLDYVAQGGVLHITTLAAARRHEEVVFYPLQDLFPTDLERRPFTGRLARNQCEWNPIDEDRRRLDDHSAEALWAFLQSALGGRTPRHGPRRNQLPLRPDISRCSAPIAGGLAVRASQREHRVLAAALDRNGPFAKAVLAMRGTPEKRRQALEAALDSRDPLASAWAVWNLQVDEPSVLRPRLLAAFVSGALHQAPQPQYGELCSGMMAWEMLQHAKTPARDLAAALEAMSQAAGATPYAEVTLREVAVDDDDPLITRAALRGLANQEGSLSVEEILRHEPSALDSEWRRARRALQEACAEPRLAELAAALRTRKFLIAEQALRELTPLVEQAPAVRDRLRHLLRSIEFNALTATPFAPRVLAPLYEDLFRDSDPEVRRLACREMTTWMLLSHPPNEQALNTLLGDPLLAEQASETLSRCQRLVRSRN